jgi:hypothetical protein
MLAVSSKVCTGCGINKDLSEYYKRKLCSNSTGFEARCKECKNKECRKRSKLPKYRAKNRIAALRRNERLKDDIIFAYGGKCVGLPGYECNEARRDALQIDHIFNDGHLEGDRGTRTNRLYKMLKREGFPKERYQLLCASCNFVKRNQWFRQNRTDECMRS